MSDTIPLTPCDNGSFCCGFGRNASECCEEGRGVWIKNGRETNINPNATAKAVTSSTAIPTMTSELLKVSTESSPPSSTSDVALRKPVHHISRSMVAGASIGGGIGLILMAGLCYWNIRLRRNLKSSRSSPGIQTTFVQHREEPSTTWAELTPADRPYEPDGMQVYQADGMQRFELADGDRGRPP